MTSQEIAKLVDDTVTPQIRAGKHHAFNDIWMVVVNDRIFCRQYSFSEKSWYTAFLDDPNGAIKCDDTIIPIEGRIPSDLDALQSQINAAYVEKYDKRFNHYPDIAHKMTGKLYMDRTMELIPQ